MTFKQLIPIAICILAFGQIQAQIVTDRPDQTESSSTVGKGDLQIESGFLVGFEESEQVSTRQLLAPTTLFRYGITRHFELRLVSQFETLKTDQSIQGISDLQIGTKIQLFKNPNKNIEVALLSHLIVPTGTKELTNDAYGTINKLSISHVINDRVGIGYNVGYDYFGRGDGDLTYSIALGVSVNEKVGVYIEPYGAVENIESHISNFDTGFTYLANDNLQFDFSFGTGLNHQMNYISVGASWLLTSDNNVE